MSLSDSEFQDFLNNAKRSKPKEAAIYAQDDEGARKVQEIRVTSATDEKSQSKRYMAIKDAVDSAYVKLRNANAKSFWRVFSVYDGDEMYSRKFTWDSPGKYLNK